jgi:hypothetical protein
LGLALGSLYFAVRKDSRGAVVAAACVPTHWLLDFIAHRPDMPVYPGGARYGLGMWNSLPLTLLADLTLYGAGVAVYLRATRAKSRTGRYAIWSLLIFLLVAYFSSLFGPPPPSVHVLAMSALALWITVAWAGWADQLRDPI